MKKLHPVVAVIAFAVMLVAVAGGTFLLGRLVRGGKHPVPQQVAPRARPAAQAPAEPMRALE